MFILLQTLIDAKLGQFCRVVSRTFRDRPAKSIENAAAHRGPREIYRLRHRLDSL